MNPSAETKSRSSRTSCHASHLDQSLGAHDFQQRQEIVSAARGIHFIFFQQGVAQLRDALSAVSARIPNARAYRIHPVVHAVLQVQDR